ncbi:MAG: PEGA domain-containing protein, partial [Fidelibacterota bacterium]
LEKYFQSYPGYIQLINPDYDKQIVNVFKRILSGPTEKDINAVGRLQNMDKLIVISIYNKKSGFMKKTFKCDARLIDIRTGVVKTFEYSGEDYRKVSQKLATGIYEVLWIGKLSIKTNLENYSLTIDDKINHISKTTFQKKLIDGKYSLKLEKRTYRPIIDKISITAGYETEKSYNFIKEGAKVEIEGTPLGAEVLIHNNKAELKGKLPFSQLLSKGTYKVTISNPGFQSTVLDLKVEDRKDQRLTVDLSRFSLGSRIKKTLLFPGLGQIYTGYTWRGIIMGLGETASIVASAGFVYLYISKKDDRQRTYSDYQASGNPNLRSIIRDQEKKMKIYQGLYISTITTGVGIYLYSLYDVYNEYDKIKASGQRNANRKNIEKSRQRSKKAFEELDKND